MGERTSTHGETAGEKSQRETAARLESRVASLNVTTAAVRTFIEASQDLTGRMARAMGTNVSDMTALLFLANNGSAGAGELADHLGMSRASVTLLVDRLERDGMVERERSVLDRRRVTISTTPAARIAALTTWMPAIEHLDKVCRSLDHAQTEFALDLLARLTAAMQDQGL